MTSPARWAHLVERVKHLLRPDNRRRIRAPWILANVGYDVVHTTVIIGVFHRFGLNPYAYVAYIVVFSAIYAWSSLAFVGALVDGHERRAWLLGAVVAVSFLAPDVFVVASTRHVPTVVYVVLGSYLAISSALAVRAIRRRWRARTPR